MSDALDRWLDGHDHDPGDEPDATNVFVQIDALAGERVERNDARWLPDGGADPAALARLVRDRHARGVLWRP